MDGKDSDIIRKIIKVLEENQSFVIFNHMNPDGDAVGSQLALNKILRGMGKTTYLFSSQDIFEEYMFLPDTELIETQYPTGRQFDVAIMVDCAKLNRIASGIEIATSEFKEVINIDHHISNTFFGTLNWVKPESSSAGELVCELVKEMGLPIDADLATCLYTALFTDTGGFRHSNTGERTLRYASELVAAGARPQVVARKVYGSLSERRFKLLSKSLGTLRTIEAGKVAYMWVTTDHYNETGSTMTDADEFVEYPRSLRNVEIACLFKETAADETTRVNLRANGPKYNVNRIASAFGGGGHAEAAAFNITGSREEIERRVLEAVHDEIVAASSRTEGKER